MFHNPGLFCKIDAMKRSVFCILATTLLLCSCMSSAPPVAISNKPVSVNDIPTNVPMPPVANIETMGWQIDKGQRQTLSDLKGKVVILDFWATYCPPCLEGIPHFVALQNKYKDDLVVVGLNVGGEEDRPKIPAFIGKFKVNYPIAYPEDALSAALMRDNSAIPQTFVFGRDGKFVTGVVGFDNRIKQELDSAVERAIAQ